MGLLSSFHCLGMCGPIALALPIHGQSQRRQLLGLFSYNFGRALLYACLGALTGTLASALSWIGIFRYLSITAGILMVAYVLWSTRFQASLPTPAPIQKLLSILKKAMGSMLQRKNPMAWFLLGSLNGLVPCGLVYLALMSSMATGGPLEGATFMLLFGIGTMPMMLAVGFFKGLIGPSLRTRMRRLVPVMLTIAGIWLIARGVLIQYPASKNVTLPICHSPATTLEEK
ncbi:hypothetical protein CLV98_10288 [Dyadobacter jejuensis]|uniref:Urease accessory protein UreH-like transmembrane domain-containing protein n=2 Tax=Dyadobacter jejuensis TaxID=1082580 RepID=A0A316APB4_9BACT|nr:hypothetical protein CLV98_10288 [Dyadobacter jejuensis]